ncbi:MAG: light-harvesting antenna LH1, alpha subunit [Pseudomonadota bacterium]
MFRIWQVFDVRLAMVGLYAWLVFLAFMIHFILLSTDRYNWLEQSAYTKSASVETSGPKTAGSVHNTALPGGRS